MIKKKKDRNINEKYLDYIDRFFLCMSNNISSFIIKNNIQITPNMISYSKILLN